MASSSRHKSAAAPAANLTLVAREAGVSVMTVSNVLRGKGRFSAATKDRVLKAAEVVGYQADPLVSRLMSRIRTPREKRAQATIALLGPWSPDHDEAKEGYFARLVAGARARAAEKLLGVCFPREAPERAGDRTGGGGKRGCGEKGGGRGVSAFAEASADRSVGRWAVFRQEKFPIRAGIWRNRENLRRFPFVACVALRTAVPRFLLAAVFRGVCPDL